MQEYYYGPKGQFEPATMNESAIIPHLKPYDWHKPVPNILQRLCVEENPEAVWSAWKRYLATRKRPAAIWSCFEDDDVLFWGGGGVHLNPAICSFLASSQQGRAPKNSVSGVQEQLDAWLGADASRMISAEERAVSTLGWAYLAAWVAEAVSAESWWELLERLARNVDEASGLALDDHPTTHQLVAGETALVLAYQFPELKVPRDLGLRGAQAVSTGLVELNDGQGLVHADCFGLHRMLLGCWTRSVFLCRRIKQVKLTSEARTQYAWAVRGALRMARSDGTGVFSQVSDCAHFRPLLEASLSAGGNEEDEAIYALLRGPKRKKRFFDLTPNDTSYYSEWAAAALMRSDWSLGSIRQSILFPRENVRMELEANERVLWSGDWDFEVRRDGTLLRPVSEWAEVCWTTDESGDYLELEVHLEKDVRVQRAIFLAKEDRFVYLADTILNDSSGEATWDYRGLLPTADRTFFVPAKESNEGFLKHDRPAALVLPLALCEWRADPGRRGFLKDTPEGLAFGRTARGTSVVVPLFFDLEAKRMHKPFTWRHLTVAESLKIQPEDRALGWRVRIGDDQWLIYRSISNSGNRTVLGHNLSSEFLIARFDEQGEVETLVEIG